MKNKLTDLNNHLFAQIERLGDEDLSNNPETLKLELERTQAIANVSKQIISGAALSLKALKFADEAMNANTRLPVMLQDKTNA